MIKNARSVIILVVIVKLKIIDVLPVSRVNKNLEMNALPIFCVWNLVKTAKILQITAHLANQIISLKEMIVLNVIPRVKNVLEMRIPVQNV